MTPRTVPPHLTVTEVCPLCLHLAHGLTAGDARRLHVEHWREAHARPSIQDPRGNR